MAENAAEISMPAFMRAGLDFFSGKTVLKSSLDEVAAKLATAEARVKELEGAQVDAKALSEKLATVEADAKAKGETIAAQAKQISDLEANYQTAARQAQQQIAAVGAQAPVVAEAPKNQEGEKTEADQFIAGYKALVSTGKTPTAALSEMARTKSALHVAFIKSGKTLS